MASTIHHNNIAVDNSEIINEELISILAEKESAYMVSADYVKRLRDNTGDAEARLSAVSWFLKIQKHYCFRAETALLAVNYLDRFLWRSPQKFDKKREWAMQLVSVACLSLAAKMEEETQVSLLDLQVEGAEYVFESATVQRMELILLGALEWRMNSVTPLSYVDHGARVLGLKDQHKLRRTFLLSCSEIALCAVKDTRILLFRPSVIAAAIMLSSMRETQVLKNVECENRLVSALKVDKRMVEECYQFIQESVGKSFLWKRRSSCNNSSSLLQHGSSPHGILDASFSCNSDGSSKSIVS